MSLKGIASLAQTALLCSVFCGKLVRLTRSSELFKQSSYT